MSDDKDLDFAAFIRAIVAALETAEVEYMIGGAVAVWAWGEQRSTQEVDPVVHVSGGQIERLSE